MNLLNFKLCAGSIWDQVHVVKFEFSPALVTLDPAPTVIPNVGVPPRTRFYFAVTQVHVRCLITLVQEGK